MAKKMTMHVITGTHWDREWRHTAEQSKLRLMDLIDSILDILDKDPEYNSFILDGGTIVLEDYFTVRPEMKEKVKSLIEAKKLFIVSWYTLPETYTVAPESLIRNLQMGTEMAKKYGGAMRAGYTATGYGQTSQLPQIYEGFGIKTAMFYRGTNKYELPPLFKWESKDGTQIFVHKTCDEVTRTNWYFYVYDLIALGKGTKDLSFNYDKNNVPVHLCDNVLYEKAVKQTVDTPKFDNSEEGLKKALKNITDQAMQYKIGDHLLALNMEDNAEPHPLHTQMVNAMNSVSDDIEITTIEKDEDRYNIAIDNINKFNLNDRINIILGDALETEIYDQYDLIFIDASKGNNINFFNKYSKNLKSYGIIITDNLLFHGLVRDENLIQTKNQRGIVRKIKQFIEFLDNNFEFETEFLDVGDGIAISRRK